MYIGSAGPALVVRFAVTAAAVRVPIILGPDVIMHRQRPLIAVYGVSSVLVLERVVERRAVRTVDNDACAPPLASFLVR